MERMPGSEARWTKAKRRSKVVFETTILDPVTGVATTWEKHTRPLLPKITKNLTMFRERRTDHLPNSQLQRGITKYNFWANPEYEISDRIEDFGKHASVTLTGDVTLALFRSVTHYGLDADYDGDTLKSIEVWPDMSEPRTYIIGFNLDGVSPISIAIDDLDPDSELNLTGVCFGEEYVHGDCSIKVHDEDGFYAVELEDLNGNNPRVLIYVPREINKEEFKKKIMDPENIGWEKALEAADLTLQVLAG